METIHPALDSDATMTATTYRFPGTFSLCGRVTRISETVFFATVMEELESGELVLLRYSIPGHVLEMYCRVEYCVGRQYKFVLLSLSDRQWSSVVGNSDALPLVELA